MIIIFLVSRDSLISIIPQLASSYLSVIVSLDLRCHLTLFVHYRSIVNSLSIYFSRISSSFHQIDH